MTTGSMPDAFLGMGAASERVASALRGGAQRALLLAAAAAPDAEAYRLVRFAALQEHRRKEAALTPIAEELATRFDVTTVEAREILRQSFLNKAYDELEGALLRFRPKRRIPSLIDIRGLEQLDAALGRGKGALIVSGHFWGHWLFQAAMGLRGRRLNAIRQVSLLPPRSLQRWLSTRFDRLLQERYGCTYLWMDGRDSGIGVRAMNVLRGNGVVLVLIDRSHTKQGVKASFLRGTLEVPMGPLVCAQAVGAPILGYGIHREGPRPVAEFTPLHEPIRDLKGLGQHCASVLERVVRKDPASWTPALRGGR